jgi:hypothetical protein
MSQTRRIWKVGMRTRRLAPIAIGALVFIAAGSRADERPDVVAGRVTQLIPGSAYLHGREGKIVSVETPTGVVYVFVPQSEVEVGEALSFSGPTAVIATWSVVDAFEGSLYRPSARTVQQQIQDQMKLQAAQEQQQPAASIIGDEYLRAIPTSIVDTREQKEEKRARAAEETSNRRLNLLLSIIGIILGILAIERLPKFVRSIRRGVAKTSRFFRARGRRALTSR